MADPDFDPNEEVGVDETKVSGLHIAVIQGHTSVVQLLINNPHHKIEAENRDSAFELVFRTGNIHLAKVFAGSKCFSWDRIDKIDCLRLAVDGDHYDLAMWLLRHTGNKDWLPADPEIPRHLRRCAELAAEEARPGVAEHRLAFIYKTVPVYKSVILQSLRKPEGKAIVQESKPIDKMDRLRDFFECPVCFESMTGGMKIFACSKDHLICTKCLKDERMGSCPQCREDFLKFPPKRHLILEKMALELSEAEAK